MNFNKYKNWLSNYICVKSRLENVVVWYLIFLIYATSKHSLEEAARFSGINKSQFSKFLKKHAKSAVINLANLSKTQAKRLRKSMKRLGINKLPWKIAIIVDSTIQRRTTRHTDNAQRFNHGQGFIIGHQWTNIILVINDIVIPLTPIPFHTKAYCKKNKLKYKTEHKLVIEYLENLDLVDYIGPHKAKEVVMLADSGYDDRDIEKAISKKNGNLL